MENNYERYEAHPHGHNNWLIKDCKEKRWVATCGSEKDATMVTSALNLSCKPQRRRIGAKQTSNHT